MDPKIPDGHKVYFVPYVPTVPQYHFTEAVRQGIAKVCGFFAGIGGGKTAVGQDILYSAATDWAPGGRFMIITPSYRTFRQVTLAEIRKFWPGENELWKYSRPDNQPQIDVYWGDGKKGGTSEIYVRSAQDLRTVEEVRGPTLAGIWGDECGTWHAGRTAYDLAIGRLRQTPPQGVTWANWWPRMWLTGSPRWGWLNRAFGIKKGMPAHAWDTGYFSSYDRKAPSADNAFYVRAARTEDNPHNAKGYAEFLRLQYGETFSKQELDGDFVSPTGAVYPHFYPDIHVISHTTAMRIYETCGRKVGGVDWGFGSPAAMVALGITSDDAVVVVREWFAAGKTADDMSAIARRWEDELGIKAWYGDPENPENIKRWQGKIEGSLGVRGAVKKAKNDLSGRDTERNCMRLQSRLSHPEDPTKPASWYYQSVECSGLENDTESLQYKEIAEGEEFEESKVKPKVATHRTDARRYAIHSELSTERTRTSWVAGL